jgi:hypothetical protein
MPVARPVGGSVGQAAQQAARRGERFQTADRPAAAASRVSEHGGVAEFAADGERMRVKLAADHDRPAHAVAKLDQQKIPGGRIAGMVSQRQRALFLDEEDGRVPYVAYQRGESGAFRPVQVGGVEDGAFLFIYQARGADEDAPEGFLRDPVGRVGELPDPFLSGAGSAKVHRPVVFTHTADGQRGQAGLGHTELNAEEPRLGAGQAEHAGGPAPYGACRRMMPSELRLGRGIDFLEHPQGDQLIHDLAGGGLAQAKRLGQVRARGGAETLKARQQRPPIEPAHLGREEDHIKLGNLRNRVMKRAPAVKYSESRASVTWDGGGGVFGLAPRARHQEVWRHQAQGIRVGVKIGQLAVFPPPHGIHDASCSSRFGSRLLVARCQVLGHRRTPDWRAPPFVAPSWRIFPARYATSRQAFPGMIAWHGICAK